MTIATTIFGTVGILRLSVSLSSALLSFSRGIIGAIFLILLLALKRTKYKHDITKKTLLLLMLTGALMGINWLLLFESYRYTSVGVATLLYYAEPSIVILLSPLVFKEKLNIKKIIVVIVSFFGMVMVSGVMGGGFYGTKGIFLALSSSLFFSSVVIMNKKIENVDAYEKTIIELLAASISILPYLLVTEDFSVFLTLSRSEIIVILILGIVNTGFSYMLYFGSMKGLKSQTIGIMGYIDPIVALLLSFIILSEPVTLMKIIGALLIIGSAIISEVQFSPKR